MLKIMENPINKMDDLGVPLFLETPTWVLAPLCLGADFPRRTASRYDFLRAYAT